MSIVKARRCTTASTRLAVARKQKREREKKISGILGAYAAGLMILILDPFLYVPKNRSPGRWVQCP